MLVSIPAIMVIGVIFEYALKIPVLRGKAFYSEGISPRGKRRGTLFLELHNDELLKKAI